MNKKFNSSSLLFLGAFTLVVSCGKVKPNGSIEGKDIKVEEFSSIDASGKFRLFYINSKDNFVALETYPNLINNLKVYVKDKTLHIEEKRGVEQVDFYNVTVYSKYAPQNIVLSDSVEFNVSSAIKTDNFKLHLKNNAKFIGSVNSNRAEVDMENKSRANFLGFTTKAVVKMKDTTSLIAPYWTVQTMKLNTKNGIYAEVNAKDSLKGEIGNTSKLVYYNDPIRAFKIDKSATVENQKLDEINTK